MTEGISILHSPAMSNTCVAIGRRMKSLWFRDKRMYPYRGSDQCVPIALVTSQRAVIRFYISCYDQLPIRISDKKVYAEVKSTIAKHLRI